jgi:hypothetical protein
VGGDKFMDGLMHLESQTNIQKLPVLYANFRIVF